MRDRRKNEVQVAFNLLGTAGARSAGGSTMGISGSIKSPEELEKRESIVYSDRSVVMKVSSMGRGEPTDVESGCQSGKGLELASGSK
jgi:hypothetical protein